MREYSARYLLHIWKDGKGQEAWRASLKSPGNEKTSYFSTLEKLIEHLKEVELETIEASLKWTPDKSLS